MSNCSTFPVIQFSSNEKCSPYCIPISGIGFLSEFPLALTTQDILRLIFKKMIASNNIFIAKSPKISNNEVFFIILIEYYQCFYIKFEMIKFEPNES